jgi:hypothetical protein
VSDVERARERLAAALAGATDNPTPVELIGRAGDLPVDLSTATDLAADLLETDEPVTKPDESVPAELSEQLDNEIDTQEGAGVKDAADAPSTCTSDDNSCNRGSCIWSEADFSDPTPGVWPPELLEREQWMGHVDKKPFAPWGDRNHPEADDEEDARWKWGLTENYVDGDTIAIAEDDHRLDGRAFLQQEDDPYAYVDGDDVRCPETGDVHPAFVDALEQLGLTYADVSQSGAGVHAQYRGELQDGVKQAAWELDEKPWGANDDLPSIEIYAGKRVCVATGAHVPGTPTEIREWSDEGLKTLLDENDQLPDRRPDVAAARERFDLDDYEPSTTLSSETTADIRDVFAAIDDLDAQRVAQKTIVQTWNDDASTSGDNRAFWPTWGASSDNGTANVVNHDRWMDTGASGGYGGPVSMAAIDANACQEDDPPVSGRTWWQGVDHLRDLGYEIPEFNPNGDDADPVVVLPNAPIERAERNIWDWRGEDDTLEIEDVRAWTVDTIANALAHGGESLVDVLPSGGKSYGSVAAVAREDSPPVSIFTTRGRKEQYGQFGEWCDEYGLTHKTLPSFFQECPTAAGDHGDEWAERVREWYRRGATGQDIHKYAEDVLGRPLPCQCDDHGEPIECPYTAAWRFDPDEYDVLLGHYVHAYNPKVVAGRGAIFDEFTDNAFERVLNRGLEGAVSYYLKSRPDVPFTDYTDLVENRDDPQRRADGIVALEGDLEPDGRSVLEEDHAHAAAPLATFTLLAAAENDLGNGLERAPFSDETGRVGIHDRGTGTIRVLTPPALDSAQAVLALDGTPTPELWDLTLGEDLHHRQVLNDDERAEYLQDGLGTSIISTSPWLKPYNSADHINTDDDAALLEAIADKHGTKPGVITTRTALTEYEKADVLAYDEETGDVTDGPAERVRWYGNVLGSNEFKTTRVGAVIGSNHYGDGYIKRWGAYADKTVERGDGKGAELSYGAFGDDVLTHMREHDTLQAALRFGRDGNGAAVYVHTDTLPDWVPVAGDGQVIRPKTDGERQVLDAIGGLGRDYWTTADVADADATSIGQRRVRQILDRLVERGHVRKGRADDDGRAVEWTDDGLEDLPDHVELPDVDTTTGESSGNGRSRTIYTHISGTSPDRPAPTEGDSVGDGVATDGGRPNRGDPLSDDPA